MSSYLINGKRFVFCTSWVHFMRSEVFGNLRNSRCHSKHKLKCAEAKQGASVVAFACSKQVACREIHSGKGVQVTKISLVFIYKGKLQK